MKIFFWGVLVSLTTLLFGCNDSKIPVVETQVPNTDQHFVLVQLPMSSEILGTKITLSLEGEAPITQVFDPAETLDTTEDYQVRFEVGDTIKPGTLTVQYPSGETKTMSQLVYDILIRSPLPDSLSSEEA